MEKKLYLISNMGCDDTTWGLVEFDDEELQKFCQIVSDLNKNSTYGCQPTITIYYLRYDDIRPVSLEEFAIDDPYEENYIERNRILYLNKRAFTLADPYASLYSSFHQVFPYKF